MGAPSSRLSNLPLPAGSKGSVRCAGRRSPTVGTKGKVLTIAEKDSEARADSFYSSSTNLKPNRRMMYRYSPSGTPFGTGRRMEPGSVTSALREIACLREVLSMRETLSMFTRRSCGRAPAPAERHLSLKRMPQLGNPDLLRPVCRRRPCSNSIAAQPCSSPATAVGPSRPVWSRAP